FGAVIVLDALYDREAGEADIKGYLYRFAVALSALIILYDTALQPEGGCRLLLGIAEALPPALELVAANSVLLLFLVVLTPGAPVGRHPVLSGAPIPAPAIYRASPENQALARRADTHRKRRLKAKDAILHNQDEQLLSVPSGDRSPSMSKLKPET